MNEATLLKPESPATSGETAPKRAEERTNLQYWLANEDLYMSSWVRKWLERTPPEEAEAMLAEIAEMAQPESHSLLRMYFHGLISMLTTAEIISEKSPAGRKAGTRAAMMLANRGDLRALAPLVRVFEPHWFWKGKYQEAIEAALLHLISHAPEETDWTPHHSDLRTLAEAVWQIGGGRQELSARQADLLLAALRPLRSGSATATASLLKTISSADVRTPQRRRVREAVAALPNGGAPRA